MSKKFLFITLSLLFLIGSMTPVIAGEKILKISTTDEVKSRAFLSDYTVNQMNFEVMEIL